MKVLVVGGGAREHALVWKLKQSPLRPEIFCAPGNPGISGLADCVPIAVEEIQRLADFALELEIDLTVVGPELPLTLGLADELTHRGLLVFGPKRDAAVLEGSKVFAKEFMRRHGIPTADFEVAHDANEARQAAQRLGLPVALKADGLAAGKGVLLVDNEGELESGLDLFFNERRFGASGDRIVVEKALVGDEVSFLGLSDGHTVLPMATCKDYKRVGDGDTGPNTGGMGAHTPSGVLSAADAAEILDTVLRPTVEAMKAEGRPLLGVLYAGLMMTVDGPKVLEFNLRFGDPEAQVLMLRLEDDLLQILRDGAAGHFETPRLHFRQTAAACIVLAAAGYPEQPRKGDAIEGIGAAAQYPDVEVFHAGTSIAAGRVVTSGGRVLSVCARAPKLREALRLAYEATSEIRYPGVLFRRDIGRKVIEAGGGRHTGMIPIQPRRTEG